MEVDMKPINSCRVTVCLYNSNNQCRTPGINVGCHAECDTYLHGSAKGGIRDLKGGVGACQASDCRFNEMFECRAPGIDVGTHSNHADCETFNQK